MKNLKLYLDMDGVLCDFEKKFKDYYGSQSLSKREQKQNSGEWEDFILIKKGFEDLDMLSGGKQLLDFVRQHPQFHVEILSSSGGQKLHGEVTAQKIRWLRKNGINYKANIVPGKKLKAEYAEGPNTILVDDTEENTRNFTKAGGIGILHKNTDETLKKLKEILDTN